MCARFTLTAPADEVADFFGLAHGPDLPPRYNIAPSQPVACVRRDRRGRWLDLLGWGLVPSWAGDPKIGHDLINARAETSARSPRSGTRSAGGGASSRLTATTSGSIAGRRNTRTTS